MFGLKFPPNIAISSVWAQAPKITPLHPLKASLCKGPSITSGRLKPALLRAGEAAATVTSFEAIHSNTHFINYSPDIPKPQLKFRR